MTTYTATPKDIKNNWFVVDATDKLLGRLATTIASRLRGKHKPEYTPHMDTGDYIIVINADKLKVTGKKLTDKFYHHYSGYPSGMTTTSLGDMLNRHPERVIEEAVKGMMPRGPLAYSMLRKLKVYKGAAHGHAAQQPQTLEIKG
jgi:large subunit ribosomal protein L13